VTETEGERMSASDPIVVEACEWISSVSGKSVTPSNMASELKSGAVLCAVANAVKPGAVKASTSALPFKQMEVITKFVEFARAFGVDERNLFVTVDLFEAKNLHAVAVCVRELKRLSGAGFDKQSANDAAPAAAASAASKSSAVVISASGKDDSAVGDASLNENQTEFKTHDGVTSRTGTAFVPGHAKLDANTGVAHCNVCTKPISGACISALGASWHAKCFVCKRCDKVLSETKFFEHANKAYCDRCILIVNPQTNVRAKAKDSALFQRPQK